MVRPTMSLPFMVSYNYHTGICQVESEGPLQPWRRCGKIPPEDQFQIRHFKCMQLHNFLDKTDYRLISIWYWTWVWNKTTLAALADDLWRKPKGILVDSPWFLSNVWQQPPWYSSGFTCNYGARWERFAMVLLSGVEIPEGVAGGSLLCASDFIAPRDSITSTWNL